MQSPFIKIISKAKMFKKKKKDPLNSLSSLHFVSCTNLFSR